MYQFGKRSLDNLKGVHPRLVKLMTEAIKESPVDFTITEGVRTLEKQKEYYSWGRTKINPNTGKMTKVTYADGIKKKSNHQVKPDGHGYAVDLYPFINGKVQVKGDAVISALKQIADHIKEKAKEMGIKIVWGGDWKKPFDPPHFQLG